MLFHRQLRLRPSAGLLILVKIYFLMCYTRQAKTTSVVLKNAGGASRKNGKRFFDYSAVIWNFDF